jgi:hypothetical protein
MASEPVLSSEVGNRTSRVVHPVMVISAMVAIVCYEWAEAGEFRGVRPAMVVELVVVLERQHVQSDSKLSSNPLKTGDLSDSKYHRGRLAA